MVLIHTHTHNTDTETDDCINIYTEYGVLSLHVQVNCRLGCFFCCFIYTHNDEHNSQENCKMSQSTFRYNRKIVNENFAYCRARETNELCQLKLNRFTHSHLYPILFILFCCSSFLAPEMSRATPPLVK